MEVTELVVIALLGDGLMAVAGTTLVGLLVTLTMLMEFKTKHHSIGVDWVNGMMTEKVHHCLSYAARIMKIHGKRVRKLLKQVHA